MKDGKGAPWIGGPSWSGQYPSHGKCLKSDWRGFPGGPEVKNLFADAGDTGLIPGLGRSCMPQSN